MTRLFHERPDDLRMAYRTAVMQEGGRVAGYSGPAIQVAIPNPSGPFFKAMEVVGLTLVEGSLFLFPLGSDQPPAYLRHDGPYPVCRGYWLYGKFTPREAGDAKRKEDKR
jgi:hypothetical protein